MMKAYKDADKHSWKKEELIAYDNASIAEQDEKGKLVAAENKGKIEGKIEKEEEVVERCWEEGMPIKTISKITNLSIEEVQRIIEKIIKRKEGEK